MVRPFLGANTISFVTIDVFNETSIRIKLVLALIPKLLQLLQLKSSGMLGFASTSARGEMGFKQGQAPLNSDEERQIESDFRAQVNVSQFGKDVYLGCGFGIHLHEVRGNSRKTGKRVSDNGGSGGGKSSKKSREESIGFVSECWAKKHVGYDNSGEDSVSIADCMTILNSLQLSDMNLYLKATKFFRDPNSRIIFNMTDPSLWLFFIMNADV